MSISRDASFLNGPAARDQNLQKWMKFLGRDKVAMMRILVIDDDANILEILAEMLTTAGYEVVEASNGKER